MLQKTYYCTYLAIASLKAVDQTVSFPCNGNADRDPIREENRKPKIGIPDRQGLTSMI